MPANRFTPDITFSPPRNTRKIGQLDMRPEAVARRKADPRSLNIGRDRAFINEAFVNEVIENVRGGTSVFASVVATGQVHPRTARFWMAEGQTECEWREFGKPCEDCSSISGHPTGCESCGFTGLVSYNPDSTKDLNVQLFVGIHQARADYKSSADRILTVNATETQLVSKKSYSVDKDGERILRGETVTEVLPSWQAVIAIQKRIEIGEQLAAFNRGAKGQSSKDTFDEAGILQFNEFFGVELNRDKGETQGPLDITPYLPRLTDGLKVQLAMEVGQLRIEDEAVRESMRKDRNVLVVDNC